MNIRVVFMAMLMLGSYAAEASNSIHLLVERNDMEAVQRYVEGGGVLSSKNRYEETPLHLARTPEMIELLINAGADVNIENHFGDSPLLQAVYRGHHGLVELLIEKGADLNHRNRFGDTPLQEAVKRDLIVMAEMLIAAGADLDLQNRNGDSVLHIAVRRGNQSMVGLLVRAGTDIEIKNDDEQLAIDLAVGRHIRGELTPVRARRY